MNKGPEIADVSLVCEESIADFYNEVSSELNALGHSTSPTFVGGSRIHVILRHPSYEPQEFAGASPCKGDNIMTRLRTDKRLNDAKLLAQTIHTLIL